MNRTILTVAGVLSASSLLLVDSAIKGTVLLALAAVVALILRRDSAATRHLVWSLAIVAMLVVPLLSAMLPQWRVLPAWMSSPRPDVVAVSPPSIAKSTGGVIESPRMAEPVDVEPPIATVDKRVAALPDTRPALVTPEAVPAPTVRSWNWINALPLVWVVGFAVLMLRLSAARWMLWNSERLATVVCRRVAPQLAFESRSDSATAHDPIVVAMKSICSQLGISRPVTLLIHPDKTIPVVWGIFRCRLMLPAAARQWSDEQLQSVLLHELAHITRRDTVVQLLAQVACALHWFNPLVWFAAWRLDVERERSCDDLVLASGVRPSAYAGHLLDVVTGLSPARWTQACGLAMARKSSLEGRLTAVLGKDLNRRSVPVALAGLALAIAVGIAVPIAMLCAAVPDEPKSDALKENAEPKDDESKVLFEMWKTSARSDGKIPGGRIGEMAASLKTIIDLNPGTEAAAKCEAVLKKCDATRDWAPAEAAALLDEISVVIPSRAGSDVRANRERRIHPGKPIPDELKNAPWGQPAANGLRTAWLLEPRAETHSLGSVLKSRVLFHNTGKAPVCFATDDWVFGDGHEATDANGEGIDVWTTGGLGISTRKIFRLAPGECAEVEGAPVGVGSHESSAEASNDKVGGWIEAEEGDAITFTPRKLRLTFLRSWRNDKGPQNSDSALQEIIAARVMQESPMPAAATDREQLLRRVMQDLTSAAPTAQEIAAFVADNTPDALAKLTKSLQTRVGAMHFAGELAGGETKFRVTAAAANEKPKQGAAAAPAPKHKDARALYEDWQRYARANGDIPGALVGELAAAVKTFIKYNPTWETVPKLNAILPRLDATHDWKSADSIALLDEVAGVQDSPLKVAAERATRGTIRKGEALPKKFADAPWGDAQPNGLRAAWVLEPIAAEHRIGAALKARLLVWNSGAVSVSLQMPTFHQGGVKARDATDAEVQVSGISWTTRALLVPVRLAPGDYIEIRTPGVGIGPRAGMGPWAGPRIGSNVLAKAGDELTLTHGLVPLDGSEVGVSQDDPHVSGPGWWLAHIKTRLNRELPLPADAAERTRLLDRALRELFATAPTAEETAEFIADKTPDALDALAKRLVARVDVVSFSGKLPTAPVKFSVLAADANADKQPRVVLGPGEYPLPSTTARRGDATLKIVGRPVGDRRTNDAQLLFEAVEFTGARPPDPHKLEIPDGWGTWAIVCRPGEDFFYLLHKGGVRKIDYSKPRQVTDTTATDLPAEFRDEVKRQLNIHEVSTAQQAEIFVKPAPPAATLGSQAGAIEPANDQAQLKPKHESAQSLFRKWQESARTDGKIPGALIGHVAREIDNFLKRYPRDEKTPKLAALRARFDASRDWTQEDVVALLDDITAISTAPISWAAIPMESSDLWKVRSGEPLPVELENAAWGTPANNGLRAVWLLDPRAEEYPLGTVLKTRVLFHNSGTKPVVFKTETWHQSDRHTARDAMGGVINVGNVLYTGETPMVTYRLEPGEYVSVLGHGIGIGEGEYVEERSTGSIGAWIEAKKGDEVSFSSLVDASREGWTGPDDPKDRVELWKIVVRQRVEREAPLPSSSADRELLIRRVTLDLFGESPTAEEIATFIADNAPDALAKLTARLQMKQRIETFVGQLPTGETKFRVIAVDPNAAKAPRAANRPGRYVLGDNIQLQVTQITTGEGSTNKATIIFPDPKPEAARGPKPYEIGLPNGIGTYGIVWERGAGVLWVMQKDLVLKYDFTNPWQVSETRFAEGGMINIPEQMQGPLKKVFDVTVTSSPASESPKTTQQEPITAWGKEVGGLQAGLGFKAGENRVYRHGETATLVVRVRNVGQNDIKFKYYPTFLSENSPTVLDETGKRVSLRGNMLRIVRRDVPKEVNLAVGKEIELYERELRLASGNEDAGELKTRDIFPIGKFLIQHEQVIGNSAQGFDKLDPALEKLATGKLELEVKEDLTVWGKEVSGLQAGLGFKAGAKRAYHHGETANIVLRVRNVGKEEVEFKHIWAFFVENPPSITDADGKPVQLPKYRAQGQHGPRSPKVAPGKEVELYEWKLDLRPSAPRLGRNIKFSTLYGTGKFSVQCERIVGPTSSNSEDPNPAFKDLATGKLELEVKEDLTAWGQEVGGLQAGLAFKAGEKRAYTHGEWATLVVRVRNVGKEEVKFQYLRQFFVEQPPTVFNEKGELKQLGRTDAFGEHIPVEVKLAAGKEIELYELKFYLGTGSEEGIPKYPYIFGTGKFQVQYEKVFGNSSSGSIKLDPALGKLATGKLELEIKPASIPKELEELNARIAALKTEREELKTILSLEHPSVRKLDAEVEALEQKRRSLIPKIGDALKTPKQGAIPVGAQGNWTNWTEEWLALSKIVADSRGLADWKPDELVAWGAEEGGLRTGLMMKARAKLGEKVCPLLVLKNVSDATKEIKVGTSLNVLEPTIHSADGKTLIETRKMQLLGTDAIPPVTLKAGEHIELVGPPVLFGVGRGADGKPLTPEWPIAGAVMGAETVRVKFNLVNVRAPETGEVTVEVKEAFTAWGKEVGGLQAGLGFKAGEQRVYRHGETVPLVVRVRNVGNKDVKFEYLRQYFNENPPVVTNAAGTKIPLKSSLVEGRRHESVEVTLGPGKDIALTGSHPFYELMLELDPSFGTGKVQVQYDPVFGNS